jgi:YhcG PDDEXK nuclease domain
LRGDGQECKLIPRHAESAGDQSEQAMIRRALVPGAGGPAAGSWRREQKRLRIDDTWFRVDLLFFHRRLRCLVVIDLKVGKFSYADAGQMHLYLNYAREQWMKEGENPPVGLILCAEKGSAEAHYALDNLPNKVLAAEYQMVLPDETTIAEELKRSRTRLERFSSQD